MQNNKTSDKKKRDKLEQVIYNMEEIKITWPNNTRSKDSKRRPTRVGMPLSYLAKTLAISLNQSLYDGPDKPLKPTEARRLRQIAAKTCKCNTDNDESTQTKTSDTNQQTQPQVCDTCGKVKACRIPRKRKQCKGCNNKLTPTQHKHEELCPECQILALVSTNKMRTRVKAELDKAKNIPQQTLATIQAEKILRYNTNVADPKLIPVGKRMTNDQLWDRAFKEHNIDATQHTSRAEAKKQLTAAIEARKATTQTEVTHGPSYHAAHRQKESAAQTRH